MISKIINFLPVPFWKALFVFMVVSVISGFAGDESHLAATIAFCIAYTDLSITESKK